MNIYIYIHIQIYVELIKRQCEVWGDQDIISRESNSIELLYMYYF